jgi:hypothetical protein
MINVKELKKEILIEENIIKTNDGVYRYVNHNKKLLTTGFMTKEGLLKNTDIIRIDGITLELMNKRYNEYFNN